MAEPLGLKARAVGKEFPNYSQSRYLWQQTGPQLLLRMGRERFGMPDEQTTGAIQAIKGLEREEAEGDCRTMPELEGRSMRLNWPA